MRFTRRRVERAETAQRGLGACLEVLERRELLSGAPSVSQLFAPWRPFDLPVFNPITKQPVSLNAQIKLIHDTNPQNTFYNNQGKVVSGTDRAGDLWTITVHGPGTVIVTDATPNDGALDDNIDTIQLLGTTLATYVTGSVVASDRTPTSGTVFFNKLISNSIVGNVTLNGFTLTQTVTPTNGLPDSDTGVYLAGGVRYLQFSDILAPIDEASADQPINIVIGDPSTPLRIQPTIRLDSIFNTVFSSNAASVSFNPQTDPTVNIVVNGQIKNLSFISSTQAPFWNPAASIGRNLISTTINPTLSPIEGAGEQFAFPVVGTTGRTAIQAKAIGRLNVRGSAINVTASRTPTPFTTGFDGLSRLGHATFGGNADALGLDVNGPIGSVRLLGGLGNPTGSKTITSGSTIVDATTFGTPAASYGYPSQGLLGGLITANRIRRLGIGPANTFYQTVQNPNFAQAFLPGTPVYNPHPGQALTSSAIVSSGSIGRTHIVGSSFSSEIKSGFNYPSFAAGLEGTRAPSSIGPVRQNGDIVDSMNSATYRPYNGRYQTTHDVIGPGAISGRLRGSLYATGATTPLGDQSYNGQGVGFFARHRAGYLPPPERAKRLNGDGVLLR
jgi:hypothetical protein